MYTDLAKLQYKLSKKVQICPLKNKNINYVAGIDVSFEKKTEIGFCCITVMDNKLRTVEEQFYSEKLKIPYIPGLLSFRELPIIYKTLQKLQIKPDIFILDSQGIAHPRGLGLASHFGVVFDKITIGCAKKILVGSHTKLSEKKGSTAFMTYKNKIVGAAVRTKDNTKPVYVSPGNKIDIKSSIQIILEFTDKYKIPEPTRRAHIGSNNFRKTANFK